MTFQINTDHRFRYYAVPTREPRVSACEACWFSTATVEIDTFPFRWVRLCRRCHGDWQRGVRIFESDQTAEHVEQYRSDVRWWASLAGTHRVTFEDWR